MEFKRVTDREKAKEVLKHLPDVLALDLEFSCQKNQRGDLDTDTAVLISIILANDQCAHSFSADLVDLVWTALERTRLVFTQYFGTDARVLKKYGYDMMLLNFVDDCLLDHLIDENAEHNLGDMVLRRYGDNYKAEFWGKYKHIEDAPEQERLEYECKDGIYQYRLGVSYMEELRGKEALIDHVHRLARALYETEVRGVKVDVPLIQRTKDTMSLEIGSYLPKLREEFDSLCTLWEFTEWIRKIEKYKSDKGKLGSRRPEFSFTSDTQLRWLVYEGLKCPEGEKTKAGNPKTDYETLLSLSREYPELKVLVDYKEKKAIYSTFVEGMLERVQNSRIYPHFNINGTSTGRISHSNPNLGNIPRDGVVRNFFVPDNNRVLVGADFSQLEVIVEANLTKDPNLIRIIKEGVSKHDITAQGLGIKRDQAKTLNFALQYGAGSGKVAKLLGISKQEAEGVFKRYWELYSGVRTLKEETCAQLDAKGFVTNLFGRTRHFPPPRNKYEKAKQERQAYNFLIQGVGADLCNRAFYLYNDHLKRTGHGETWWSVHDEVIAQVLPDYSEEEKIVLVGIMEALTFEIKFEFPLGAKSYGPFQYWQKA